MKYASVRIILFIHIKYEIISKIKNTTPVILTKACHSTLNSMLYQVVTNLLNYRQKSKKNQNVFHVSFQKYLSTRFLFFSLNKMQISASTYK